MPIAALDVIWIFDNFIKPPGPKMMVCIEPKLGFFYRINTENKWQHPVPIKFNDHSSFLSHDSYIECGDPLELDDYLIEESIRRRGIVGKIACHVARDIYVAACKATTISVADKELIRIALGCIPLSDEDGN